MGQICSNFMRDTFTINIDLVSNVNLEIEGAGNKGLEVNKKTRVCIEFALGTNTRVWVDSPWEIQLGLSLLVTERDWDFG